MAGSLNRVMLIGNLGKDPEIRAAQDGRKIANLSVATSESWKDKTTGEKRERTEWHRVVIFNEPLVGIVEKYLKKGSKVFVEGQLQTRKWTDKDGVEKYTTEIVLQNYGGMLKMLSGPGDKSQASEPAPRQTPEQVLEDEIPFALMLPAIGASAMMALYSFAPAIA